MTDHASSNRVPTRERLAEIAACVISGELDWGVPSMDDTDPWEIADLILKEFGPAIPKRAATRGELVGGDDVCHKPHSDDPNPCDCGYPGDPHATPNRVWIITEHDPAHGDAVMGVYASEAGAKAKREKLIKRGFDHDKLMIDEWTAL